jgi:hypothetical protein
MAHCDLCNDQEKKSEEDARLGFDFIPEEIVRSACERGCASSNAILQSVRRWGNNNDWSFEQHGRRVYARCRGLANQKVDTLSLELYFEDERPKLELELFSLSGYGGYYPFLRRPYNSSKTADTITAWKGIMPRPSISGHPLSSKALAWVGALLRNCKEKHMLCTNAHSPRLPKRILAIESTTERGINVKLVESHKLYAPYAALSHCWGNEQTCITTLATLGKHKKGIPWGSIPKTFQDAIKFALKLDIKYLWVDSLCIIQDDISDWDIQSSEMADIYQNSYLTLAATASSGDSQGCFPEGAGLKDEPEIHIPQDVTDGCPIGLRKSLKHWNTISPNLFMKNYPLLSRAWVFQERMLSPRVLHFCRSELVWECRETAKCECGGFVDEKSPGGEYHQVLRMNTNEDHFAFSELTNSVDLLLEAKMEALDKIEQECQSRENEMAMYENYISIERNRELQQFQNVRNGTRADVMHLENLHQKFRKVLDDLRLEKETSELSRQYRQLVERYSVLQLSRTMDRLPALSGLCARIAHLRGNYLAGLWLDSVWFDLLWRVDVLHPRSRSDPPSSHRGPSWSWTSVEVPIKYWHDFTTLSLGPPPDDLINNTTVELKEFPEALTVRTLRRRPRLPIKYEGQLAGKNPFGEVIEAVITVESYSRTATVQYVYDSQPGSTSLVSDPLRYNLALEGVTVPFFADYGLNSEQDRHKVFNNTEVTLLLIHPQVALVVMPRINHGNSLPAEKGQSKSRFKRYLSKLPTKEKSKVGLWQRIGIARASDTLLDLYQTDWMREAKISQFKLV